MKYPYSLYFNVKNIPEDFSEQIFDETSLKTALYYEGACKAIWKGEEVLIIGWDDKGFKINNGKILPYYHFMELSNIKKAAPLS